MRRLHVVTGGRNGYGAKLANIYSTEFRVETVANEKRFVQVDQNDHRSFIHSFIHIDLPQPYGGGGEASCDQGLQEQRIYRDSVQA